MSNRGLKKQAVIFDLDGVLVSTDEQHFQAWKALCDHLGIAFDREVNNKFRGVSRMVCMDMIEWMSGSAFTPEQKLEYADWKNRHYRVLLEGLTKDDLSVEVKGTLETLRLQGYCQAVGSSSKNARFILARIGLDNWFDAVVDGTEIYYSKPDPEVFLRAAHKLGIEPDHCVVVEDAASGVQAAKAANMTAIAIGDARKSSVADYWIDNLYELKNILKG